MCHAPQPPHPLSSLLACGGHASLVDQTDASPEEDGVDDEGSGQVEGEPVRAHVRELRVQLPVLRRGLVHLVPLQPARNHPPPYKALEASQTEEPCQSVAQRWLDLAPGSEEDEGEREGCSNHTPRDPVAPLHEVDELEVLHAKVLVLAFLEVFRVLFELLKLDEPLLLGPRGREREGLPRDHGQARPCEARDPPKPDHEGYEEADRDEPPPDRSVGVRLWFSNAFDKCRPWLFLLVTC
mmetsp:Transcript_57238/g.134763  ORF Transcript_57238/g.134763 Transcript_57238/m.134763 type:complete len:239 (-) Transcript_57238:483-1199(-)